MNLSFLKDDGDTISIDAPVDADLQIVMASLEKTSGIPITEQVITFDGRTLDDPRARISQLGVTQNSILSLQRRARRLSVVTQDTRNIRPGSPCRVAPELIKDTVDPPVSPLSYHRYGPVNQLDEPEEVTMLYVPVEIKNHTIEAMVGCSVLYSTSTSIVLPASVPTDSTCIRSKSRMCKSLWYNGGFRHTVYWHCAW
ncbi:hypothetical protein SCLCIDRAFT_736587 [Scleroderma citrinum Foug A]|uniref:Ubiquitin-like domain-containing protein n=1 Tax=Scleroderma citrinum Foug A TaxID=1036808 RepID=A0A0C3E6Q0_9AGAM|nr:hypothetical protein SCLCIDRAFT_736587 [Scleroderma citrinum Foug A]